MPRPFIVGCLLAGGGSTRMGGGQKFRLPLGDVSIIERIRERLRPQVDELIVSARAPGLEELGLSVVLDSQPDAGPLAGIQSALDWVATTHGPDALLLTVPADTPFLPRSLAARLREAKEEAGAEIATAASASGVHPTISLWSASLAPTLSVWMTSQADRSVHGFIARHRGVRVHFEGAVDPFFNINEPADLERAERLLAALKPEGA
jgi:molybdenum cofactor guanylyltransferase